MALLLLTFGYRGRTAVGAGCSRPAGRALLDVPARQFLSAALTSTPGYLQHHSSATHAFLLSPRQIFFTSQRRGSVTRKLPSGGPNSRAGWQSITSAVTIAAAGTRSTPSRLCAARTVMLRPISPRPPRAMTRSPLQAGQGRPLQLRMRMTHTLTAPGEPGRMIHCLCDLLRPMARSGGTGSGGRGSGKELQGHSRPARRTDCPRTRERTCIQRRSVAAERMPRCAPLGRRPPPRGAVCARLTRSQRRRSRRRRGVEASQGGKSRGPPGHPGRLRRPGRRLPRTGTIVRLEPHGASPRGDRPSARHRPTALAGLPRPAGAFACSRIRGHRAAGRPRSQPGPTGVGLRPPETLPFR